MAQPIPVTTSSTTSPTGTTAGRPSGSQLSTLTGTVTAGVGPGCLVLEDEKTRLHVTVIGGNKLVRAGARVTVVGRIRKDLRSYCQQGPLFEVITASTD